MFLRSLKVAIAGALFLGLVAASTSASTDSTHVNYLTFTRTVSLPGGVQLVPGTYRFEIASSAQDGVVRVTSKNLQTIYLTAFTNQIDRPRADVRGEGVVTLSEVAAGNAAPITAWYPMGESIGHQFVY